MLRARCPGDCDGDQRVGTSELVLGINIALGRAAAAVCSALDADESDTVEITDLVAAIDASLRGCSAP